MQTRHSLRRSTISNVGIQMLTKIHVLTSSHTVGQFVNMGVYGRVLRLNAIGNLLNTTWKAC